MGNYFLDKIRSFYESDFRTGVRDATDDRIFFVDEAELSSLDSFRDHLDDAATDTLINRFRTEFQNVYPIHITDEQILNTVRQHLQESGPVAYAFPNEKDLCLVREPFDDKDSFHEFIAQVRADLSSDEVQEYLKRTGQTESDLFDESRLDQQAISEVSDASFNRLLGLHEGTHCETQDVEALSDLYVELNIQDDTIEEIMNNAPDQKQAQTALEEYIADRVVYEDAIQSGNDHVVDAWNSYREARIFDDSHPAHGQDEIDRLKQTHSDSTDQNDGESISDEQTSMAYKLRDVFSKASGTGAAAGASQNHIHSHAHHGHSHGFSIPEGHIYGNEVPAGELTNIVEEPAIATSGDPALLQAGGSAPQTPATGPETAPEVAQPQPMRADMATP